VTGSGGRAGSGGDVAADHLDVPEPLTRDDLRGLVEPLIHASPLLVLSDFDGTLAPISLDPAADTGAGALIDPLARRSLRRLAAHDAVRPGRLSLAILSGRPAADVAGRVRVGGIRYVGNHGLEDGSLARGARVADLSVTAAPGSARHVPAARALARAVAGVLGGADWLFVEEKGPSVAFHWRGAPDEAAAGRAVLGAMDAAEPAGLTAGFDRLAGRRMAEFRPSESGGKGAATERLIDALRPRAVLVLGDDRSDAEAFAVVAAARASGRLDAALIVAVHGAHETPREVVDGADLVLASPHDAARLLAALARALEPRSREPRALPGTGAPAPVAPAPVAPAPVAPAPVAPAPVAPAAVARSS
jgi:trehalose 6-phosphate phosphatase